MSRSFPASEAYSRSYLGFPGALVEDWHDKAIAKMGDLLGRYRSLQVFMDACVHCGACTDKCHYFLGTADPEEHAGRSSGFDASAFIVAISLSRARYFPSLVGAKDLTKEVLQDWYSYYYQCSECRRCSVYLPLWH